MNKSDIKVYTVAETSGDEQRTIQARWFGGSGVSIFVDGKEVDVFTKYSIKSSDDLAEAFAEYLRYQESLEDDI